MIRDIPEDTLRPLLLTVYYPNLTSNPDVRAEWNSEDYSAPIPILTFDETEVQKWKVATANCKFMIEPSPEPWPPNF